MSEPGHPTPPNPTAAYAPTSDNIPLGTATGASDQLATADHKSVGIEPVMVILSFDTDQPDRLGAILAHYVVLSRTQSGCRNIDLVTSAVRPGRMVVVEKWDSHQAQLVHFDSPAMIDMAQSCDGVLNRPPDIDLLDSVSMHDLA